MLPRECYPLNSKVDAFGDQATENIPPSLKQRARVIGDNGLSRA
jgi:hypothetical protein